MNNNLLQNLQTLNFLMNLEAQSQAQAQLLQRPPSMPPMFSSNPSLNFPYIFPNLLLPLTTPNTLIENAGELGKNTELLSRVYQNNLQTELLKAQIMGANALQSYDVQALRPTIPNTQNIMTSSLYNSKFSLEAQVKNMVNFVLLNFGPLSQTEIEREKLKYTHDETLSQIFNNLVLKYSSMNKTKEEMIKYVFRKAFKAIKDKLKGTTKKSEKEVTKLFFQNYFSFSKEDILRKTKTDLEDEEEILKLLLPFKKTSANKTMNSNFLSKIFASEEFCAAYEQYLSEFEREAESENVLKVQKFVTFIMSCVKSNKISQILNYKRVPWLRCWIVGAKNIGYQLMYEKSPRKIRKIEKFEKQEFTSLNELGTSESDCKLEEGSTAASS